MNSDDYGWFTPAEFELVLQALNKNQNSSSPAILVGGQSLVAWIKYYNINIPDTETPALTQDVDFLGKADDAKLLAKELNARIKVAGMDDHTPNTAVLSFQSVNTDKILIVDFLNQLLGLKEEEVRKLAVLISIESSSQVYVLHPILCVKSRFENLHKLKNKRNGNGITQARMAIEVVKRYLVEISQEDNGLRQALNATKKIREIALSDAGIFVYHEYSLDILSAIDVDLFEGSKFVTLEWPHLQDEVMRKRDKKANIQ